MSIEVERMIWASVFGTEYTASKSVLDAMRLASKAVDEWRDFQEGPFQIGLHNEGYDVACQVIGQSVDYTDPRCPKCGGVALLYDWSHDPDDPMQWYLECVVCEEKSPTVSEQDTLKAACLRAWQQPSP